MQHPTPRKIFPRRRNIPRDLRAQLIGAGKLLFVAQPLVETHFHRSTRNLFGEPEQMALDGDALAIERWPRAHVGHRRIRFPVQDGFRRIDPKFWKQFLLRNEIERREQDRPASPGARAEFLP